MNDRGRLVLPVGPRRREGPYRVHSMHLTLQGEGAQAGRACILLRFTGCNLWTGLDEDRAKGGSCAQWCDTWFHGTDGYLGGEYELDALASAVEDLWGDGRYGAGRANRYVVATGGEPLLQLDAPLVAAFRTRQFEVGVETNGTVVPPGPQPVVLDWTCVSPKAGTKLRIEQGDELKVVWPQDGMNLEDLPTRGFRHLFVQPKDGPDQAASLQACMHAIRKDPRWRLSLQQHKLIGLP